MTIPEALRWTDARRGETFILTTLNVRLLPDSHLAAKAYGRPAMGGRGTYTSFAVPGRPELAEHRYLYIEVLPERAGGALHTVFVEDLDDRVESIGARGSEPGSRETYGNGVRKVICATPTATRSASAALHSGERRVLTAADPRVESAAGS